jgi:hypothetical protein
MAIPVGSTLQLLPGARILGLSNAIASDEAVTLQQMTSAVNGNNWKDNVRVASVGNINLATPGATIDGITLANGDRALLKNQTTPAENGIYIWTGAAIALTRSIDTSAFDYLESAIVVVDEGTAGGGTRWRQTAVNGTLGTTAINWVSDGAATPVATETVSGTAEVATQTETDAGTVDNVIVTPLKLKNSPFALRTTTATIGDGSATTFSITHSFNTFDVEVSVRETGGTRRKVIVETDTPDVNTARVLFASAPVTGAYRVTVARLS